MFVIDRETGHFLWAHPFLTMTIPNSTWAPSTSSRERPASTRTSCSRRTATDSRLAYTTHAGLWSIAYHRGNNAVYVPFQDQCLTIDAQPEDKGRLGTRRAGVMRPRPSTTNKFMNIAKIDIATARMKILALRSPARTKARRWSPRDDLVSGAT